MLYESIDIYNKSYRTKPFYLSIIFLDLIILVTMFFFMYCYEKGVSNKIVFTKKWSWHRPFLLSL